jgi:hypothetical protein
MPNKQQGARHQSARDIGGGSGTYQDDMAALQPTAGLTLNGRLLAHANSVTGETYTNVNDALAALAIANEAHNFSSLGVMGDPTLIAEAHLARDRTMPSWLTANWPGTRNYIDESGVMQVTSTGEVVFGHDYETGESVGAEHRKAVTLIGRQSRNFSDSLWVKTNISLTGSATDMEGGTDAYTMTADANNGTILQSYTQTSRDTCMWFWVRRVTGTGTIEFTVDGGTTWNDITADVTTTFKFFKLVDTLANPEWGFRLGTSGDEIVVDQCHIARDDTVSAFVTTTTGHVAMGSCYLDADSVIGDMNFSGGTCVIQGVWREGEEDSGAKSIFSWDDGSSSDRLYWYATPGSTWSCRTSHSSDSDMNLTSSISAPTYGDKFGAALGWADDDAIFAIDGVLSNGDSSAAFPPGDTITSIDFGSRYGGDRVQIDISTIKLHNERKLNPEIAELAVAYAA